MIEPGEAVPVAAVAVERTRLARELHDGLAQPLWVARLHLDAIRDAASLEEARDHGERATRLIEAALRGARASIDDLRAPRPEETLGTLLQSLASAFAERSGLAVEVRTRLQLPVSHPYAFELARIIDEALINVLKHASASVVRLDAERSGEHIRIRIRDNGVGAAPRSQRHALGIVGMRERAASLGGTVDVRSMPGKGTVVTVLVPATLR